MLPRERVETALAFRTPDKIPLQVHPSPAGLPEHGQKLLDLMRACGSDFGDHAMRTDAWGATWEYRIFGVWGHPVSWPLNDLSALDAWRAAEVHRQIEIDPGFPWENVQALFSAAMEARR